jgi:hypothetical protein
VRIVVVGTVVVLVEVDVEVVIVVLVEDEVVVVEVDEVVLVVVTVEVVVPERKLRYKTQSLVSGELNDLIEPPLTVPISV